MGGRRSFAFHINVGMNLQPEYKHIVSCEIGGEKRRVKVKDGLCIVKYVIGKFHILS